MSSISVNTTKVLREQSSLQSHQKKLDRIADSVGNVRLNLSFDLQGRERIVKTLSSTESLLEGCKTDLGSMESVLGAVMARYQETEERVKERSGQLAKSGITNAEAGIEYSSSLGGEEAGSSDDSDESSPLENFINSILDYFKGLMKILEKLGDSDRAGVLSDFFSYIKNIFGFITGDISGWSGISDWCDLADGSTGMWSAVYDIYKSKYSNLEDSWGGVADAVSVIGSLFGLFGGVAEAVDTFLSGTTVCEKIASAVDAGSGLIDVVKSIYKIGQTAVEGAFYTAADLWAAFAKTVTSSVSQLFDSIGNYFSDGVWDIGDTGATGVEVAVAGLTTLFSAISFGIISPETFGTTAEDISSALEQWTEDLGTWIGELILSY